MTSLEMQNHDLPKNWLQKMVAAGLAVKYLTDMGIETDRDPRDPLEIATAFGFVLSHDIIHQSPDPDNTV